jgi:hypothetical protein
LGLDNLAQVQTWNFAAFIHGTLQNTHKLAHKAFMNNIEIANLSPEEEEGRDNEQFDILNGKYPKDLPMAFSYNLSHDIYLQTALHHTDKAKESRKTTTERKTK